ncbi:hypothetical protein [Streptomyces sp. NBC_01216]|uniref:hypothetical protein n=1 Tax=unclassified Streptomyces TaxID=2593676 RepID=UPI002E10FC06|nr:hypothetical protein OG393_01895 [Streptomyces sp. NBC_01216]
MTETVDATLAGRRVEEVLDRLAATGDRDACAAAEELVRVLMDFYGAGLARIVGALGDGLPQPLLADELVAGLLTLHALHPEDVRTRIARALDAVAEPLEQTGYDETTGVLRLRPSADEGGCGCSGGEQAGTRRLEDVLAAFAPEVTAVETEPAPPPEPPLLQIGVRPHSSVRVP